MEIKDFIDMDEKERIKLYSSFPVESLYEFINNEVTELRVEYEHIEPLSKLCKCPKHRTGIFISNKEQYIKAISYCIKNKIKCYYGLNPKKRSYHPDVKNARLSYNGTMYSEVGFYNLCFDFDPNKDLSEEEGLKESYLTARKFLEDHPKIKKYLMGCSGRGVQIIIPLDHPIILPALESDENKQYVHTEEFDTLIALPKKAFKKLTTKYKNLDESVFSVARVARVFPSLNLKKDKTRYAGIIEIKGVENNEGLYDYIMEFKNTVEKEIHIKNLFSDKKLQKEFLITNHTAKNCKLSKLLLTPNLPDGGRNNILFFQFKILLKQCGIDIKDPEIQKLIKQFRRVQHHSFIDNNVPEKVSFNPEVITNWCIDNMIKPIYSVLYNMDKKRDIEIDYNLITYNESNKLCEGTNIKNRIINTVISLKWLWNVKDVVHYNLDVIFSAIKNDYGEEYLNYIVENDVVLQIVNKIETFK